MPFEQWHEVIGTGYAVASFPIHRIDALEATDDAKRNARRLRCEPSDIDDGGWRAASERAFARKSTPGSDFLALFPGYLRGEPLGAGVIVAVDQSAALEMVGAAVKSIPTATLYAEPVDETKRDIAEGRLPMPVLSSDRDNADDRVIVPITIAFEDLLWPLLEFAVSAAGNAAMILGRDAAANPARRLRPPALRRVDDDDRENLIKAYITTLRDILRGAVRDDALARTVGRKAEEERDHRAYCLRERLVRSEEFAGLKRNARFAKVKARVIQEVIAPAGGGYSASNYQRVMDSGKAIHRRISPDKPFCER